VRPIRLEPLQGVEEGEKFWGVSFPALSHLLPSDLWVPLIEQSLAESREQEDQEKSYMEAHKQTWKSK
jgi:hypothetical protein